MSTVDEQTATMEANLKAKTGKSVSDWVKVVNAAKLAKHGEIVKFLKDAKLKKVQAAIQADQVRVSAPSKDDLQDAIRLLRGHDFGVELQFGNYR